MLIIFLRLLFRSYSLCRLSIAIHFAAACPMPNARPAKICTCAQGCAQQLTALSRAQHKSHATALQTLAQAQVRETKRTCCMSRRDNWRARASFRVSTLNALYTRSASRARPASECWLLPLADDEPPAPGGEGPPGMSEATPRDSRTSPPTAGAVRLFCTLSPASRYPAVSNHTPCHHSL